MIIIAIRVRCSGTFTLWSAGLSFTRKSNRFSEISKFNFLSRKVSEIFVLLVFSVTNVGLYSVRYGYDTNPSVSDHTPHLTKLINLRNGSAQHVKVGSHESGWFLYTIEHQKVSVDLFDRRTGQCLRHFDNKIHHDALPIGFHGFCVNENYLVIVQKFEVLSTINNPHQIENEKTIQVHLFDLETMNCCQQMNLTQVSNVRDMKCCYKKNIFFILAEPLQLMLIDLDKNEILRKQLIDDGKHLCLVNENDLFVLRSECSIQTLHYRSNRSVS